MTPLSSVSDARGTEQSFDKAKKHLWASDSPRHEMSGFNRYSEQPRCSRPEVEQGSSDHDECQSNSHGDPSTSQRRSERKGCIQPSSSRSSPYTLPPLSRERTHDRDVRPLPSRFTKFMDHSPRQDGQLRRSACTDLETYHDSRQQRPVSLSVFNSPTATYAWERYEPESQIPYPRPLYVDYVGRSSTRSASSSSISSLRDSPGMPSPALSDRSISTPTLLPQKRRSSSPAGHYPYHASSVTKIMEPLRHVNIEVDHRRPPVFSRPNQRTLIPPEMISSPPLHRSQSDRHVSAKHSIPSDGDERHRQHEDSPCGSDSSDQSHVTRPTIPPKSDSEEWEKYACFTLDGTARKWLCTWLTESGGQCKYMSKKQLVKRHVETTHLRYKPFVCGVCSKGFPQKTSLDTHMHGHTGSTPHACRYNCGMWFKDPARRHRHMVDEHQYVPRQSKKKHTNGQPQDTLDFESVQRWNVAGAP
ncbi:hypothetical protein DEU56DRAFT_217351 [Suillus clintonianus]|uniref:uncharacterized protein n=1 Tax=Suillus clintonianus TaxID=1904413 RepID=UPI001B87B3A8|nr:uncharacterized protein DEU56DRAFT_217351 [Suillus clintonianus]KAG2156051.1 hypothetical protein DEU56DRAFT_217351 [Suillus clintonianus]